MCQWIGNMNCSEEVTFQCQGSGIIDCTGTCPGDEETLETMMKMIQDPEMAEKFPMIAAMQNKTAEAKGGNNSKFLQMLRGCGFEKLIALMSLASGGFGGGEESEITQVDESALSGFGGDYYCEEGIPTEAALLALLAAFAVSYAILYMASTTNTGRKKRELSLRDQIQDIFWGGKNYYTLFLDLI